MSARSLAGFTGRGYDKGRSKPWQLAWFLTSFAVVERSWCPSQLRVWILRLFGAEIGSGVFIRQHVRIHWPWKLTIGNDVWIGVDAWLLNLEPIVLGSDVCISQSAFLCTGSHSRSSPTFEFDNAPIRVGNGVWIAARATILRGVEIGDGALIGATALVARNVNPGATVLAPGSITMDRRTN